MPTRCRTLSAFSLIELLVVVGVMALLISILVPSLAKARGYSREVACATSLRTWGHAFHLYANDYDGTFPHTDDRARNQPPFVFDPEHPEHECCYIDVLPPLLGRPAWRDFPDGSKPTDDIWQCPDARVLPDSAYSPKFEPSVRGYHSYAMNSYLEHDFQFGLEPDQKPYPSFLRLERCEAPGKTLLLFEQTLDPKRGSGGGGGHPMAGCYTAEDARAVSERHAHKQRGFGANVVMIDSHLEWRDDLWDEALPNGRIPTPDDLTWHPY
jgi:type II secretory pathway pseudopilin PulG